MHLLLICCLATGCGSDQQYTLDGSTSFTMAELDHQLLGLYDSLSAEEFSTLSIKMKVTQTFPYEGGHCNIEYAPPDVLADSIAATSLSCQWANAGRGWGVGGSYANDFGGEFISSDAGLEYFHVSRASFPDIDRPEIRTLFKRFEAIKPYSQSELADFARQSFAAWDLLSATDYKQIDEPLTLGSVTEPLLTISPDSDESEKRRAQTRVRSHHYTSTCGSGCSTSIDLAASIWAAEN